MCLMKGDQAARWYSRTQRCRLPVDQGSVQAAAEAGRRRGDKPPASCRAGQAGSGLLHAVPCCSDPVSPHRSPLKPLVDSTGIKFLGDGALSGDRFAILCRVTNGRPARTAPRGGANGARCIGPWRRLRPISARGVPASRDGERSVPPDCPSKFRGAKASAP